MTDRVAHEVQHRIHHSLDEELVDLGALTGELELDALAVVARQIANDERHAAEDLADRHQAHAHDALAQIAKVPFEPGAVVLERAPFLEGHVSLDTPQRVLEPRPGHHHVADQPHQLVEPGQIHADDVG